jgi:hypothetical protein
MRGREKPLASGAGVAHVRRLVTWARSRPAHTWCFRADLRASEQFGLYSRARAGLVSVPMVRMTLKRSKKTIKQPTGLLEVRAA